MPTLCCLLGCNVFLMERVWQGPAVTDSDLGQCQGHRVHPVPLCRLVPAGQIHSARHRPESCPTWDVIIVLSCQAPMSSPLNSAPPGVLSLLSCLCWQKPGVRE